MSLDETFEQAQKWADNAKGKESHRIEALYDALPSDQRLGSRHAAVATHILDILETIQRETKTLKESASPDDPQSTDLIYISLHDMKTFSLLMNILIIDGLYECLAPGVGIPLRLRSKKLSEIAQKPRPRTLNSESAHELLTIIVTRLIAVLKAKGDVHDLILLGPYTADLLSAAIQLDFDPEYSVNADTNFVFIRDELDSYSLLTHLTSLLRPGCPPWFAQTVSRSLATLPLYRPNDGVRSLIEFVSGLREKEEISVTELERAVKLLRAVPNGVEPAAYWDCIGLQFFKILGVDMSQVATVNHSNLILAAVHIIHLLFEQRPVVIMSGFTKILTSKFNPGETAGYKTPEQDLSSALFAVGYLLNNSGQPKLLTEIRKRIIESLWLLLCFQLKSKRSIEFTKGIISSLLNISPKESASDAVKLSRALLTEGRANWEFGAGPVGGVEIRQTEPKLPSPLDFMKIFEILDQRVDLLMGVLKDVDEVCISGLFISVLKSWLQDRESQTEDSDSLKSLVTVRVIQRLSEDYKDKIMKSPSELVDLVTGVIHEYAKNLADQEDAKQSELLNKPKISSLANIAKVPPAQPAVDSDDESDGLVEDNGEDSDDEDNEGEEQEQIVRLCIALVSGIFMEGLGEGDDVDRLQLLQDPLQWLTEHGPSAISEESFKALEILKSGVPIEEADEIKKDDDSVTAFRKALKALDDPVIPNRAHGLHTIRELVRRKDPVVSVEAGLKIFLGQLKDEDSFIYLNAIKGLEALTNAYGYDAVLPVLLGRYADREVAIDERLRIGEVILLIIQRLDKALGGSVMDMIAETLVGIVSRKKKSSGETAQDDRLRMSALSILGVACEANPRGVGQWLVDIVDCAVGILTFETGKEQAIMRRASIVLVSSLLKGIDSLETFPKNYVAQVVTRIKYTRDSDDDVLVREQAATVIDMIEDRLGRSV